MWTFHNSYMISHINYLCNEHGLDIEVRLWRHRMWLCEIKCNILSVYWWANILVELKGENITICCYLYLNLCEFEFIIIPFSLVIDWLIRNWAPYNLECWNNLQQCDLLNCFKGAKILRSISYLLSIGIL